MILSGQLVACTKEVIIKMMGEVALAEQNDEPKTRPQVSPEERELMEALTAMEEAMREGGTAELRAADRRLRLARMALYGSEVDTKKDPYLNDYRQYVKDRNREGIQGQP